MARSKDFIYISPCKPPLGQLRFFCFFSYPNRVIYCLWNKYHLNKHQASLVQLVIHVFAIYSGAYRP